MDSADDTRISASPRAGHGPDAFAPGSIVAGRYRIVAPLGRGGMGEVFRADDLKLGAPVALKFLPASLQHNEEARARLLAETRLARTISHPNVCRVYDVGDVDGRLFLTMEYIDGEDLASLLRRIGRLPSAKTTEIARQLCAGLAAAHERGVLHRDLKPSNVMIDGRGHARITDFGLAIEKHVAGSAGDFAGTVAYMAPERLHGAPATIQSDLYALGLILYEVCTGRHAFRADTLEAWRAAHDSSTPDPPSESSGDVDPALERVILRCLQKTPARRPSSAAVVAASLPGGDPLAAAIAAGETPSPELVAASGEEGTLPRRTAWVMLGACVIALAVAASLWQWITLINMVPFKGGPEVLQTKAREALASLGYSTAPHDSAWFVDADPNQRRVLLSRTSTARRFEDLPRIRPTPLRFCYRQSPADLRPLDTAGLVRALDPAPVVPEDILINLDTLGRLTYLRVVPPVGETRPGASHTPDWRPLLDAAGLSAAILSADTPSVVPPVAFDAQQAWTGMLDGDAFRFEAAAFRGRVVFAQWGDEGGDTAASTGSRTSVGTVAAFAVALLWLSTLPAIVLLARHNVMQGRGDRRGARRVALFVLGIGLVWNLGARHWTPDVEWLWTLVSTRLGSALFRVPFVWLAYLALEPFVRRTWPHRLIGWARLIDARWRDPLVGRGLLAGVLYGATIAAVGALPETIGRTLGLAGTEPYFVTLALAPPGVYLSLVSFGLVQGVIYTLGVAAFMVIARVVLRSDRAVFAATAVIVAIFSASGVRLMALDLMQAAAIGIACVWFLNRFGLLALAAGITVNYLVRWTPWTFDLTKWFAWRPVVTVVIVLALALWGFRNVLGRQSAFPKLALD